jgi:hypothetical protein
MLVYFIIYFNYYGSSFFVHNFYSQLIMVTLKKNSLLHTIVFSLVYYHYRGDTSIWAVDAPSYSWCKNTVTKSRPKHIATKPL